MTRLLHDHDGTGLCAVAPSGRVLGVSGLFLRAVGLASPPSGAMLHDLLPLAEACPPCAGWHWLLDLPPAQHELPFQPVQPIPPAPPVPHEATGNGRTPAAGPRPAGVRGGMLVRTLPPAEAQAIPGCPPLLDPRAPATDSALQPASHGRTGVLLQLHAPDLPDRSNLPAPLNLPDRPHAPDRPAIANTPHGPDRQVEPGQQVESGEMNLAGHPASDSVDAPANHAGHTARPTPALHPVSPPVPDAHLRQALDALSVGLAHDFGNVVASILGFAEIAISRLHAAPATPHAADPMVLRSLDKIVLGCQRAREVIAFAQSIAGRMDLNTEPVDLHALVTAWCAELADGLPPDARWAVSCGLPPEWHSPSSTPPASSPPPSPPSPSPGVTGQPGTPDQYSHADRLPHSARLPLIRVDAARLREAFAEIWRNAAWAVQATDMDQMHAAQSPGGTDNASPAAPAHLAHTAYTVTDDDTPAGRILVETTPVPASPRLPGRWVRVRVRDTGKGMDADTLCRVRDPYFSTKARHEGKGRGLARAAGIVRAHGGRLDITTGPGLGCMVDILLPVAD